MRRDKILNEVRKNVPMIYPFIFQAYSSSSMLYFDQYIIDSEEGIHQGDPVGPFLFALGIKDLVDSCESELNLWYLDDCTLAGKLDTVLKDLKKVLASEKF